MDKKPREVAMNLGLRVIGRSLLRWHDQLTMQGRVDFPDEHRGNEGLVEWSSELIAIYEGQLFQNIDDSVAND